MAKIEARPTLQLQITLVLNETEARALEAISGYDPKRFLEVFYSEIGRSYLEPHAGGIHSLFESVAAQLPPILRRMDEARKLFNGDKQQLGKGM